MKNEEGKGKKGKEKEGYGLKQNKRKSNYPIY
jgi:hypothetical protein